MAENNKETKSFLIKGRDYLDVRPDFKFIGRKDELDAVLDVLLRKNANNNLILYGKNGVGLSSILLGLQANQLSDDMPVSLAAKDFYYLDVDGLFASGNPQEIDKSFKAAINELKKSKDPALVIDDTKGFIDGLRNNGTNNLMNVLMDAAKGTPRVQVIFEAADSALRDLYESHSGISKLFTLRDVGEPNAEDMRAILDHTAERFSKQYGVNVSKEAVDQVMELAKKYPGLTLDLAQPKRSIVILEGALVAYCRTARLRPQELDALEEKLSGITRALAGNSVAGDLAGKTPQELEALKLETQNTIDEVNADWASRKDALRIIREDQTKGLDGLRELDQAIAGLRAEEQALKNARKAYHEAKDDKTRQTIKDDYKLTHGEDLIVGAAPENAAGGKFKIFTEVDLTDSEEITALKEARAELQTAMDANQKKYAELMQESNGDDLTLTDEHVLAEFSRLSHVPANKLKQDESQKLLNLAETLKARVFGQDEPIEAISKSVKRGRTGLKKPNKPIGSFIFIGPSGVGKTELAKALADSLFGDESALQIYNMSEYGEKHAGAVLIGAPPGYEGHAEGGLLTNNMRRMPSCINLFDEIEKADKQVFDLFLQIIDEGVLVDRRGVKASFANSINILTSNVGAQYFLDESLTFEEAKKKALKDLWNPEPNPLTGEKGFRPEFLNRFTGIFCFNRLGQIEIIKIANKSLKELNQWIADKGISVEVPEKDLKEMCQDQYDPKNGGRGIMNYIENNITSNVADTLLQHPNTQGTVEVTYVPTPDKEKPEQAKIRTQFTAAAAKKPSAQNDNSAPATVEKPATRKTAANNKQGPNNG